MKVRVSLSIFFPSFWNVFEVGIAHVFIAWILFKESYLFAFSSYFNINMANNLSIGHSKNGYRPLWRIRNCKILFDIAFLQMCVSIWVFEWVCGSGIYITKLDRNSKESLNKLNKGIIKYYDLQLCKLF